eukprot:3848687-Prymnesium_polylepis.1
MLAAAVSPSEVGAASSFSATARGGSVGTCPVSTAIPLPPLPPLRPGEPLPLNAPWLLAWA